MLYVGIILGILVLLLLIAVIRTLLTPNLKSSQVKKLFATSRRVTKSPLSFYRLIQRESVFL